MGEVVVLNHLTLDGVMQAPGRPDEDVRGGFAHGGWRRPRGDLVAEAFEALARSRACCKIHHIEIKEGNKS